MSSAISFPVNWGAIRRKVESYEKSNRSLRQLGETWEALHSR